MLSADFYINPFPIANWRTVRDGSKTWRAREKVFRANGVIRAFVAEHYRGVSFLDVIKLTASHYFGIVPLHQNQEHRRAYLQTAAALLSSIPKDE